MLREYKYIMGIDRGYTDKKTAWEEFTNSDEYDSTKEYILVRNQIWIIYQLLNY